MRSRMSCPEQAIVAAALKCETRAKTDIKLRPPRTARVLLRAIRGESAFISQSQISPDTIKCARAHRCTRRLLPATTSRTSGNDRSVVCMIDRVCFVMYRCKYELLISPYNLFHPTINTLHPSSLLRLWAAVTDCSVCG